MITLQADGTDVGLGKERHLAELAPGHAVVEIVAVQNVFKIFHAVDFMHAFFGRDEQADVVPLADGLGGVEGLAGGGINRRLIERVEPTAADLVHGLFIILQLEFRASRPDGITSVGDMKHDATIAGLGNIVIELQLKPIELVGGYDVAGAVRVNAHERAVFDLPAAADIVALEIVPAGEILTVK